MISPEQFKAEAIEKCILRQGWSRLFFECEFPGITSYKEMSNKEWRLKVLKLFAEEPELSNFSEVVFLPPDSLDNWCFDIIPTKEFLKLC